MGTISVNKLGGLALIVGPIAAIVGFLLRPGGGLIGGVVDPADVVASITAIVVNGSMATMSAAIAMLGLLVFLYGMSVLVESLKGGNGEAIARLGLLFFTFSLVAWVVGSTGNMVIASGDAAPANGALYAIAQGLGNVGSVFAAIAILLISWAIATRDDFNKNFALVIVVLSVVMTAVSVVAALDSSMLQTAGMVASGIYLVSVAWVVTIGISYYKKG